MKISIGADHRGYALKKAIIEFMQDHTFIDEGAFSVERVDYPMFAKKVCSDVLMQHADVGILICGSGVGMSIAANRHKNIYAALCWSPEVAMAAKAHDGANILILPADFVTIEQAMDIVVAWMQTPFSGGRYEKRLCKIDS